MKEKRKSLGLVISFPAFFAIALVSGCISIDVSINDDAAIQPAASASSPAGSTSAPTGSPGVPVNNPVVLQTAVIDDGREWDDITDNCLENTKSPFKYEGKQLSPRVFKPMNWIVNESGAVNGNVSNTRNQALGFVANNAPGVPSTVIINGKLHQTIELEAGTYRFNVTVYNNTSTSSVPVAAYIVAALGNDLPDAANVEQAALGFIRLPSPIPPPAIPAEPHNPVQRPVYPLEFSLSRTSTVSLGFVVDFPNPAGNGNNQSFYEKVELFKLKEKK